jgi:outer membrane lipoprotein-sorting protein
MRRLALALALAACSLCAAAEEAFGLTTLMRLLAAVPAAEARFTEVHRLQVLEAPLELRGTLRYVRPDRLERHVESPFEETIRIEGDRVSVDNPARGMRRSYALASLPATYALVESLRATLAGDRAALERYYRLDLSGTREAWHLSLTPRDAAVAAMLTQVRLQGSAARITRIEYDEGPEERTVITLRAAQP